MNTYRPVLKKTMYFIRVTTSQSFIKDDPASLVPETGIVYALSFEPN